MSTVPTVPILRLGPPDGPGELWDVVAPARFPRHVLRFRNQRHAERVGLGHLCGDAWERHFARFEPLPGNLPHPLALRYHGHQFRVYNGRLGDGRGFLYAQLREQDAGPAGASPRLLDLGTKGSGTTPWSRGGDGRLTLQGGVREVLATEMLEALGVSTSKSLSLFETGEDLYRGDEPSPARSSVLVRLSHSHVRVGTFQRLATLGDRPRMQALADYVAAELLGGIEPTAGALLRAIVPRVAATTAAWMVAGFVHGVLNTDNLNVTGESFDYGPWRWAPTFDPTYTAAYFDEIGLYAFGRQPEAVLWNLTRLHEALALLGDPDPTALAAFEPAYRAALADRLRFRLGLQSAGPDADAALVAAVFAWLQATRVPLDRFYFDAWGGEAAAPRWRASPLASWYAGPPFAAVRRAWADHAPARPADLDHPYLRRAEPVTMQQPEVLAVWRAIADDDGEGAPGGGWAPFEAKVADVRTLGAFLAPTRGPA